MRTSTFPRLCLYLALSSAVSGVSAQEGHPLKGSWLGSLHAGTASATDLLLVLDWNDRQITGTINPGTDNIAITSAELDPENWTVRLEADGIEAKSGTQVHYVMEGRLEQLELPHRSFKGTWTKDAGSGDFELVRQ